MEVDCTYYSVTDTTHNNITITNSTFTNNKVGGIWRWTAYITSGTDTHNNISITNSTFTNNTVGGYGGGLVILL